MTIDLDTLALSLEGALTEDQQQQVDEACRQDPQLAVQRQELQALLAEQAVLPDVPCPDGLLARTLATLDHQGVFAEDEAVPAHLLDETLDALEREGLMAPGPRPSSSAFYRVLRAAAILLLVCGGVAGGYRLRGEQIREVPVEKIVYQDRIVEKPVDRIVEVPVDKIIYRDRVVEKPVERIVYKDRIVEKPVDRIIYRDRITLEFLPTDHGASCRCSRRIVRMQAAMIVLQISWSWRACTTSFCVALTLACPLARSLDGDVS